MTATPDLSTLQPDSFHLRVERSPDGYDGPNFIGPFSNGSDAHRFIERLSAQIPGTWACQMIGMVSALAVNRALAGADPIPPIPAGLCGDAGCVFKAGHEGEHSWGGAS